MRTGEKVEDRRESRGQARKSRTGEKVEERQESRGQARKLRTDVEPRTGNHYFRIEDRRRADNRRACPAIAHYTRNRLAEGRILHTFINSKQYISLHTAHCTTHIGNFHLQYTVLSNLNIAHFHVQYKHLVPAECILYTLHGLAQAVHCKL